MIDCEQDFDYGTEIVTSTSIACSLVYHTMSVR